MAKIQEVIDPVRSRNMAAVKGKNTGPELLIRKAMHRQGFRYSLHNKAVAGAPDIFLKKYNAAIFINGCFWHLHNCERFSWPKTRQDFWKLKLKGNKERDIKNIEILKNKDVRVLIIWECAMKGKSKLGNEKIVQKIIAWLDSKSKFSEITG